MSTRRSRLAVTVLLLISAMIISAPSFSNPYIVNAAASITTNPTFSLRGAVVSITGSGFSNATFNPTTCQIYSVDSANVIGTLISSPICTISSGSVSGSFVVNGALSPIRNPYAIIVNATVDASHFMKALVTFTVVGITINPVKGTRGQTINVNGTVGGNDQTCAISGVLIGQSSCVLSGSGGGFTGSFVVSNAATPGPYTIRVTGSPSSVFVEATFNVTGPSLVLNPIKGQPGTTVNATGSGFSFSDTSCTISGTGVGTPACSINAGTGIARGSFTVTNVAPGFYVIRVTGNTGDFAENTFQVTSLVTVKIIPSSGPRSTRVSVNGTLSTADTSCSLTGTPVTSWSCSIVTTSGNFTASFITGNVAIGPYTITVTGNTGDFLQTTFTVTAPSVSLLPASGRIGIIVGVTGTGFSFSDTTCSITGQTSGSSVLNAACSINAGTGTAKGNFTVGSVPIGSYIIRLTGNDGDFAEATFQVTGGPAITLNPAVGAVGTKVNVIGTGYLPSDTSCSISGSVVFSQACFITAGSGAVNGSFFVSFVITGTYVVTVTASPGGDSAQAIFTVTSVGVSLVLTPTSANNGATVSFRGTGFNPVDTGCTLLSSPNTLVLASSTCTMSSGVATGTFVVGPYATRDIQWNITVRGTPANDIPVGEWAFFNVTASVTVTPNTGTVGSIFAFTGSGFTSTASSCTANFAPPLGGVPTSVNCGVSSPLGLVSGSFTPLPPTVYGTYVLTIRDNTNHNASTTFTVGTPTAQIALSPNIVTYAASPAQYVGVSGTGFNPGDSACNVTAGSGPSLFTGPPSCSISGGSVSGSFQVSSTAIPGFYLITVTGTSGDFASNYLEIAAVTSTTTSITSVTSSVTTTTATSITTSIPVTLTTTSMTITGVSTYSSITLTTTTITGQSSSTISTTTSTTSVTTSITSTSTTITVTSTSILGQVVGAHLLDGNMVGLITVLSLLGFVLLRRLAF